MQSVKHVCFGGCRLKPWTALRARPGSLLEEACNLRFRALHRGYNRAMASAKIKTQATEVSVDSFIDSVEHPQRQADARILVELMGRVTGEPAVMWGPSIIGFGRYHYKYESGREGDMCAAGFSPRKTSLVVYLLAGAGSQQELLARLGPYTMGKSCLYIKRLADIDMAVLEQLIRESYEYVMARKDAMHRMT